ncbi:SpoIIE family protein phosphatase [Aestuariibacter sp. AA17]|uniref:SpoIIE family protein phosphatase n=1 Tax=Fluctibacter corallii TaxID=2984329 RepID=A0ABT3AA59_9ALTE|nr:SpoIIE family protein phosphatase [Aestuariibacter sp. AA17]MCV2885569.1 SpoIIE family protein phosphatase [Aestuariibacter sp. AA17]
MRILVVDDESLNRFLLVHMLEEAGYKDCYEAENGQEALKLAEKIKPDLVLLDIVMPDMSGYDVAPILKKKAGGIYLPVIFITALDDQSSLAKCLEVGGDDFASKPFDKVILTAKIRAHGRTRELSKKTFEQKEELTYYRNSVEREHAIVEHIFANALTINKKAGRYFDYRLAPASSFNGDLFLIEPSPSGGLYFLMGDFTGHGLASAIGALPVTRAFQAMASKGLAVSEMAATINHTLLSLLPVDMFFAAAIVEVAKNGTHINVWNGGMPDLILINREGEIRKHFESMHMSLGILDDGEFDDVVEHFQAEEGDRLLGYSDGLVELTNAEEKMLGEEAFYRWLKNEPDVTVTSLNERIEKFRGNAEQLDDITLVSFYCKPLELDVSPNLTSLPFEIHFALDADKLKKLDPVHDITMMIASQMGLDTLRSDISTVLSELFNNALDHGLLKLDSDMKKTTDGFFEYFEQRLERLQQLESGFVHIDVKLDPDTRLLTIEISDSGQGFDISKVNNATDNDCFGRGIPLIREICHDVHYYPGGTRVKVDFLIK